MSLNEVSAATVRLLADRGEDVPSAREIAAAAGMSRSAFFRRFASTGDAVFADHDLLLEDLEKLLNATPLDPASAIIEGSLRILGHHLAQPEVTRLRSSVMRESPTLRDRELVVSHRYERVYAKYLVEHADLEIWEVVALSAAIVAIHNATLRRWLHDPTTPAAADLARDLERLTARFLAPTASQAGANGTRSNRPEAPAPSAASILNALPGKVLVAVYDSANPATVLAEVARAIEAQRLLDQAHPAR